MGDKFKRKVVKDFNGHAEGYKLYSRGHEPAIIFFLNNKNNIGRL